MKRTPSNFNIAKVLEKKKRNNTWSSKEPKKFYFQCTYTKETLILLFVNAIDPYKKKERKEKQKNLDDSGKIEKIPIDGPTQRIKTSIVEKISLHPLRQSSFTPLFIHKRVLSIVPFVPRSSPVNASKEKVREEKMA